MADIPQFDYYALDYLDFAELNLRRHETATGRDQENELISCVANLKRALDCQIECFLNSWNLRNSVKKRNLGLETKLKFFADVGFLSSRTISRFMSIRNRVEHDFQRPDIKDLEALFDLVNAFVVILQASMTAGFNYHIDCSFTTEDAESRKGSFTLQYERKEKKFVAEWWFNDSTDKEERLEAPFTSPEDFAYFFRVLLLLNQFETFASFDHIRARLKG